MPVALFAIALLAPPATIQKADEARLKALLTQVDESNRGRSSHSVMSMRVKTKRYERSMKMEGWSKGTDYSLTRFLEPAKDRGVATLKIKDKLWNYLPNTDRTMRQTFWIGLFPALDERHFDYVGSKMEEFFGLGF